MLRLLPLVVEIWQRARATRQIPCEIDSDAFGLGASAKSVAFLLVIEWFNLGVLIAR